MPTETSQRRIRVPEDKNDVFDVLCSTDDAIFDTKAALLLFAAAVGFYQSKRVPFERSTEPIRLSVFEDNLRYCRSVFGLLAIRETDSTKALSPERFDERAKIFEEYANGGLEIIRSEVTGAPGENLELIVSMITALSPDSDDTEENLISGFDLKLD